jgi:hypothetical protein
VSLTRKHIGHITGPVPAPLTIVDAKRLGATAVEYLFAALDGEPHSGVIRQPC